MGFVFEGRRNDALFQLCLANAPYCDDKEDLIDVAFTHNENCNQPPLSEVEVVGVVSRVWAYKEQGRLFTDSPATYVRHTEFETLCIRKHGIAAVALLIHVRRNNGWRKEAFVVSPIGISRSRKIIGMHSRAKVERALNLLLEVRILERVRQRYKGADGRQHPARYRFASPGL